MIFPHCVEVFGFFSEYDSGRRLLENVLHVSRNLNSLYVEAIAYVVVSVQPHFDYSASVFSYQ